MKIEKPKPFVLKRKALGTLTGLLKQDADGHWIIDWDGVRDMIPGIPHDYPHIPPNPIWVDPYNVPINPFYPYDANPLNIPIQPINPIVVPNNPINPPVMPDWMCYPNDLTIPGNGTWITPTWTHTTTDNITVTYTNGTTSGSEVINDCPLYDLTLTYNAES